MGDKIQYYCLNEPMTCDILPSQSVIFGHRLCAHQVLHSQIPPEPNGGSAASASALRPQHSHLLHKRLDQFFTNPPSSFCTYSKLSTIQPVSPTKRVKAD